MHLPNPRYPFHEVRPRMSKRTDATRWFLGASLVAVLPWAFLIYKLLP